MSKNIIKEKRELTQKNLKTSTNSSKCYKKQKPDLTVKNIDTMYKPILYSFKISNPNPIRVKNGNSLANCPPFHVQLDHTLALIWTIFSNDCERKNTIGVAQIQWALIFLRSIYNQNCEHHRDIELCIDIMEEALIQKYAEMADSIKPPPIDNLNMFAKAKLTEIESIVNLPNIVDKPIEFDVRNFPFSITYADMTGKCKMKQHTQSCVKIDTSSKQCLKKENNRNTQQILKFLKSGATSLKTIESGITLSSDESQELIKDFLLAWRKEQIKKIQEELRRLHSIELFINSVHKKNFTPYFDTNQLDTLISQKIQKYSLENDNSTSIFLMSKKFKNIE